MKKLFMKALLTSLLAIAMTTMSAFTQPNTIDEVVVALRSGDADGLSKYFDDNLELTLPIKSDSYSKAQALVILKDFFGNNSVKGFDLKHKGDSPGGHYCVGTLQTKSGNFRATIFMKAKTGKEVINQIRFQSLE
jgi:hypothetical protein